MVPQARCLGSALCIAENYRFLGKIAAFRQSFATRRGCLVRGKLPTARCNLARGVERNSFCVVCSGLALRAEIKDVFECRSFLSLFQHFVKPRT